MNRFQRNPLTPFPAPTLGLRWTNADGGMNKALALRMSLSCFATVSNRPERCAGVAIPADDATATPDGPALCSSFRQISFPPSDPSFGFPKNRSLTRGKELRAEGSAGWQQPSPNRPPAQARDEDQAGWKSHVRRLYSSARKASKEPSLGNRLAA